MIDRSRHQVPLKAYSNAESYYRMTSELTESKGGLNYYSTNYCKFQKNAPGADMLNR